MIFKSQPIPPKPSKEEIEKIVSFNSQANEMQSWSAIITSWSPDDEPWEFIYKLLFGDDSVENSITRSNFQCGSPD